MIKKRFTHVNSKRLASEIDEFLHSEFITYEHEWDNEFVRDDILAYVAMVLHEFKALGHIYQYKFFSDSRNNTPEMALMGVFCITIQYKQANCLNTTTLRYELGHIS